MPANSEEDWFDSWVSDNFGCSLYPRVKLDYLPADYDLCVYYECGGGTSVTDVTCNIGSYYEYTSGTSTWKGCCSYNSGTSSEEVELDPNCTDGTNDSGFVLIRILPYSGAGDCSSYRIQAGY